MYFIKNIMAIPNHAVSNQQSVLIPYKTVHLAGNLSIPKDAQAIVLFVHGSGSSRFSQRNQQVAETLQKAGFATLLFDLLTSEEEALDSKTGELRFDIELLAARLLAAKSWILKQPATRHFLMGYFGASTGGGAALVAAAQEPQAVKAVVSRGGRPDLAGKALLHVRAPTLLIVGGNDETVIDMNRQALLKMHCITRLEIVPGATHLFEEPGALDTVVWLAKAWFMRHLK
jgi:dienelactone hydrolase